MPRRGWSTLWLATMLSVTSLGASGPADQGQSSPPVSEGDALADLMLGLMDRFGVTAETFGNSTAQIDLLTV